jgi:hypothetical protein
MDWVVDNDQNSRHLPRQPALQPADQIRPGQSLGLARKAAVRRRRIQLLERQIRHRKQSNLDTNQNTASLLVKVHF